jgi:L-lactate dehydrogenase complex protein LldG
MASAREAFLECVRKAVAEGNRAGAGQAPLPNAQVGYQGAGDDHVAGYAQAFEAAGGKVHIVANELEAVGTITTVLQQARVQRLVLGQGPVIDRLRLKEALRGRVRDIWQEPLAEPSGAGDTKDSKGRLFAADAGITGVDWLIAETGSMVMLSRSGQARSLSLLPPLHIAVASAEQILPDLFDLFAPGLIPTLPANITLITGPSKTGDIELKLVTGVHGPGEVHVVIIDPRLEQSASS